MKFLCQAFLILTPVSALLAADPISVRYRETADKIIAAAMADNEGYAKLTYLCDRIGNRLAGSESLHHAIAWSAVQMKKDGLENVLTPEVMVPRWVRGRESASIIEPVKKPLTMLGLGGSIATKPGGITAAVVPVASFDEMERLGKDKIAGKIVLFNVPYQGYGHTVVYRHDGASRAARLGAVAALVRSITPISLQSAHTGVMDYAEDAPKIPTAALTIEGALMIQRLTDSGETVQVHLDMEAKMISGGKSANVIGEIPGREKPEEIVVIGGHIDSWDVGQGAQDDGTGIITALQAAALLKKLGLQPRRTLRVVFWTNEENGSRGGKAYREWVGDKIKNHVAGIEMDSGGEKPVGFGASPAIFAQATEIAKLLEKIGSGTITQGGGGADIAPLMTDGMPGLGLRTVGTHYFDWHHTESDTIDKVDPQDFRLNIATMAVMAYVLADVE